MQQSLPFTVLKRVKNASINSAVFLGCNSPYRLRYWNNSALSDTKSYFKLQQSLPFTVLKRLIVSGLFAFRYIVATVLTVYGIETDTFKSKISKLISVATVLTVYGIETPLGPEITIIISMLQQSLPFTVLKHIVLFLSASFFRRCNSPYRLRYWNRLSYWVWVWVLYVATVLTVYGIETWYAYHHNYIVYDIRCNSPYRLRYWNLLLLLVVTAVPIPSCNSPYRLRYAPKGARRQRSEATMKSALLLP